MSSALALDYVRTAIQTALVCAAPLLVAALVIGVLVGILQAVTQIQEQTLTFVPKVVGLAIVFVLVLPWLLSQLVQYLVATLRSLPSLAS